MTRIIITGSKGRVGQLLLACAARNPELQVTGQVDLGDDLRAVITNGDVVIDFSSHTATPQVAQLCTEFRKALVIGTTGHTPAEKQQISDCKATIPMVWSSN